MRQERFMPSRQFSLFALRLRGVRAQVYSRDTEDFRGWFSKFVQVFRLERKSPA